VLLVIVQKVGAFVEKQHSLMTAKRVDGNYGNALARLVEHADEDVYESMR